MSVITELPPVIKPAKKKKAVWSWGRFVRQLILFLLACFSSCPSTPCW